MSDTCAPMEKNYAIIRTGGKQYRVSPGQRVAIEKIEAEVGAEVLFNDVLMIKSGESDVKIGRPVIDGAKVTGKVVAHELTKKVLLFKKRRRKGYTKKQGHRQAKTRVLIEKIG